MNQTKYLSTEQGFFARKSQLTFQRGEIVQYPEIFQEKGTILKISEGLIAIYSLQSEAELKKQILLSQQMSLIQQKCIEFENQPNQLKIILQKKENLSRKLQQIQSNKDIQLLRIAGEKKLHSIQFFMEKNNAVFCVMKKVNTAVPGDIFPKENINRVFQTSGEANSNSLLTNFSQIVYSTLLIAIEKVEIEINQSDDPMQNRQTDFQFKTIEHEFPQAPENHVADICSLFEKECRIYTNEKPVFLEGSLPEEFYILKSGSVKYVQNFRNFQREIASIKPGQIFGHENFFTSTQRSFSAFSVGPSTSIYVIKKEKAIENSLMPLFQEIMKNGLQKLFLIMQNIRQINQNEQRIDIETDQSLQTPLFTNSESNNQLDGVSQNLSGINYLGNSDSEFLNPRNTSVPNLQSIVIRQVNNLNIYEQNRNINESVSTLLEKYTQIQENLNMHLQPENSVYQQFNTTSVAASSNIHNAKPVHNYFVQNEFALNMQNSEIRPWTPKNQEIHQSNLTSIIQMTDRSLDVEYNDKVEVLTHNQQDEHEKQQHTRSNFNFLGDKTTFPSQKRSNSFSNIEKQIKQFSNVSNGTDMAKSNIMVPQNYRFDQNNEGSGKDLGTQYQDINEKRHMSQSSSSSFTNKITMRVKLQSLSQNNQNNEKIKERQLSVVESGQQSSGHVHSDFIVYKSKNFEEEIRKQALKQKLTNNLYTQEFGKIDLEANRDKDNYTKLNNNNNKFSSNMNFSGSNSYSKDISAQRTNSFQFIGNSSQNGQQKKKSESIKALVTPERNFDDNKHILASYIGINKNIISDQNEQYEGWDENNSEFVPKKTQVELSKSQFNPNFALRLEEKEKEKFFTELNLQSLHNNQSINQFNNKQGPLTSIDDKSMSKLEPQFTYNMNRTGFGATITNKPQSQINFKLRKDIQRENKVVFEKLSPQFIDLFAISQLENQRFQNFSASLSSSEISQMISNFKKRNSSVLFLN